MAVLIGTTLGAQHYIDPATDNTVDRIASTSRHVTHFVNWTVSTGTIQLIRDTPDGLEIEALVSGAFSGQVSLLVSGSTCMKSPALNLASGESVVIKFKATRNRLKTLALMGAGPAGTNIRLGTAQATAEATAVVNAASPSEKPDLIIRGNNIDGHGNTTVTIGDPFTPLTSVFDSRDVTGRTLTATSGLPSTSIYPFDSNRLALFDIQFGTQSATVAMPARADDATQGPWVVGIRMSMDKPFTTEGVFLTSSGNVSIDAANNIVWGPLSTPFTVSSTVNVFIGWDGVNRFLRVDGTRVTTPSAFVSGPTALGGVGSRVLMTRLARGVADLEGVIDSFLTTGTI